MLATADTHNGLSMLLLNMLAVHVRTGVGLIFLPFLLRHKLQQQSTKRMRYVHITPITSCAL
jgi:hypothetical protein